MEDGNIYNQHHYVDGTLCEVKRVHMDCLYGSLGLKGTKHSTLCLL